MPIEVSARLLREAGVFIAGESVECEVTVRNRRAGGPGVVESLAWCSVQLHCQEVLNGGRVKVPPSRQQKKSTHGPNTALLPGRGENGFTVHASRPTVLFCDLQLRPEESRSFRCTEVLPEEDTPPTYKGHAVKYMYKLTIGVQHVNSPVKLLRIPLRVLRILTTTGFSHLCDDDDRLSPSNPFLNTQLTKASVLDIANQMIENITAVKNCHIYSVTNSHGRIGSFTLFKNGFKLGEDILGRFSFEDGQVPCVQYCVSLQSIEELTEEYKLKDDQPPTVITHVTQHAVSFFYAQSEVKLHIPLTATPTFFTDVVHLKWRLHFEFVTSTEPLAINPNKDGLWMAPNELDIETMVWDLPLKVFPCSPLNACLTTIEAENCATLVV
uniref:RGP1 n=1 Tax=Plectus sambesii TaxID=2011161 RepID=A0A914V2V0_9BILA